MTIPETDLARVRRWCAHHVPAHLRHELRVELEVRGHLLTVVERRPPWRPDRGPQWSRSPVARLRYTAHSGLWTLYWRDRNEHFHRYPPCPASRTVETLLDEVDRDQTGIFWG